MIVEKPFYESVTLWVNILSIIVVAITVLLQNAGAFQLTTGEIALGAVAIAVLNAMMRAFTNQPIAGGPGARALRARLEKRAINVLGDPPAGQR